jgi:hypothetical protein
MLKLATILDNPGEPVANTRYRDPAELKRLGYNGVVLYETTGLSGIESPDSVAPGELRRWVTQQFDSVHAKIEQITATGLDVYIAYDALSLPVDLVNEHLGQMTCSRRATTLCPASEPVLDACVRALGSMLRTFDRVRGVVLRIGDSDAGRLPYLVGNDIYSPHCARCSQVGRADRIAAMLDRYHALVVRKNNRRLIARTWNVRPNGLHDAVELCQHVRDHLPGADDPTSDQFILSFKFTHTDFWRYQRWNPASLCFGDRPIMYELQCQREFEGKGGFPNWQVPLWCAGPPENPVEGDPAGLAEVSTQVNLVGLWAWVRGGGWGGPFVNNEDWIDANAFAVPRLADNPQASARDIGEMWLAERLQLSTPESRSAVLRVLEASPEIVRKGMYIGPYAVAKQDPWHPSADWIQDDVLDAQAAWRMIQKLPGTALDDVVHEKAQAVEALQAVRAGLQVTTTEKDRRVLDPLVNTLVYEESLLESLRDLLAGLVAYRRYQRSRDVTQAQLCRQRLFAAQSHWSHHTQRHGSLPGTATPFREQHFWDLTQRILGEIA